MGRMAKHNFKIGNKVKLKTPGDWNMGDRVGIIVRFTAPYIRVDWAGKEAWVKGYPHLPKEIKDIVKVGEQLMFSFMGE